MSGEFDIDYIPPKEDYKPLSIPKRSVYCGIITEYNSQYCESIIEHCQDGGSVESFPGKEYIDPDAMGLWCDEYPEFKAAVKIAFSAEFGYWEQLCKQARDNVIEYKDILPTINRKLSQIESTLCKSGLRKTMFNWTEPDPRTKSLLEDAEAIKAIENFNY